MATKQWIKKVVAVGHRQEDRWWLVKLADKTVYWPPIYWHPDRIREVNK